MGFLSFYPKDNQDGTVSISASDETRNDLISTPIVHENTSAEEGYATLIIQLVGNVSDSVAVELGFYYGGEIDGTKYITLEDYNGNTSFSPAVAKGDSAIFFFALNRQKAWTLVDGLTPAVTKTGTNGALTVNWRMLQR